MSYPSSEPYRDRRPFTVVLANDYQSVPQGYASANPRSMVSRQANTRTIPWLAMLLLVGLGVFVVAWFGSRSRQINAIPLLNGLMGTPARQRDADAQQGELWFVGSWVCENGPRPQLELRPYLYGLTGRITLDFSQGYAMALPVLCGLVTPDQGLLFQVEGRPNSAVPDFYFLQKNGDETASLYLLSPPPRGRPVTGILLPNHLGAAHRLVARMARPEKLLRPSDSPHAFGGR